MLLKEINRATFKQFGTPLRSLEPYEQWQQTLYEEDIRATSYLWHFNTEIVIAPISGVGLLYIRTEDSITQKFLLDQPILIRPNVQFAILPYDEVRLKYYIYSQSPKIITPTASTLTGTGFVPNVNVKTMYTILYQEKNKEFSFRGEKHVFWEFTYVNKGTMICSVDNVSYELKQGQMMFFAPHQFHEQRSDGKAPLSFLTVTFDGDIVHPESISNRVFTADDNCLHIIRSIIGEERENRLYSDDMIACEMTKLIITVVRNILTDSTSAKTPTTLKVSVDNKYIDTCMEVIHENITSPITLPWLAQQLNLSSSYLSSLFKQKVGRSISEYIRLVRLEKVKEMIREGRYTIAQISDMMGYCSPTYLSTEFKREYDMSPKEYAKMIE